MKTPEATTLYKKTLDNTVRFLRQTEEANPEADIIKASSLISGARRIFFTGSGSSIPASMFAGRWASQTFGFPAQFATTSQVAGESRLRSGDVVVLVSQGWNRSDALLVTDHVKKTKAALVGLTGNAGSPYPAKSDILFTFFPPYRDERIFCRPASVITGYALLAGIVARAGGQIFSFEQAAESVSEGIAEGKDTHLPEAERYVILSSGLALPAATNICLGLREGAGLSASVYEIESFGHGWYVPDQIFQRDGGKVHYVLLSCKDDKDLALSVKRILPLLQKTGSSHEIWMTPGSALYGNIYALARGAQAVYNLIEQSGYDMNNPPGKEENRYFHDLLLSKDI